MDKKDIFNRLEYVIACVSEFAQRFSLETYQAYAYLRRFSGIEFLLKHYEAEHILPIHETIEDLQALCKRNGGKI